MTEAAFDHSGFTFDDFLAEEGLLDDAETWAVRRVIAWQLAEAMRAQGIDRDAMAERMGASRSRIDGLLAGEERDIGLATLERAARVLGKRLRIEVVDGV